MNKISIRDSLYESGWYQTTVNTSDYNDIKFRFRVLSFDKIDLNEVDELNNVLPNINLKNSKINLLKLEIVSLFKAELAGDVIRDSIVLLDQYDYKFYCWKEHSFIHWSNYALVNGIANLSYYSHNPKIKFTGGIIYNLPEDDEAEYDICVTGTNIEIL